MLLLDLLCVCVLHIHKQVDLHFWVRIMLMRGLGTFVIGRFYRNTGQYYNCSVIAQIQVSIIV